MAHNLNFNQKSQEYAFYSRKELPWHGLGQFVQEAEDAEEALRLAHLDYEVKTGKVFVNFTPKDCTAMPVQDGFKFVDVAGNVVGFSPKRGAKIPGYKCLYRDDTKEIFDIVTDRYEVVQNFESLDVIFGIIRGSDVVAGMNTNSHIATKKDIVIETAGALGKGETIFVTTKMPSYSITIPGKESDVIDRYIVFTSSHDKSGMIVAMVTTIRVVCNNTLTMALESSPSKVAVKHTKNVRERMYQFGDILNVANNYSTEVKQILEHMATIQVTAEDVKNYVYDIFIPDDKRGTIISMGNNIDKMPNEVISSRLKNKVNEVMSYIERGPGQDVAKGTAYWMYNGVTAYFSNGVTFATGDDKFQGLIGGTTELLVKKAYEKILNYV
jgi:phage/plasmid-like protein (TIGR03299 family)